MKTIQHTYSAPRYSTLSHTSLRTRFLNWCEAQERNRLGWVAIIITAHGCFLTPLTLLFIMLAGNSFIFWPLAIGAMGMTLVSNLAAMPTRITLPLFFLSLLIDLVVIANCLAIGLGVNLN